MVSTAVQMLTELLGRAVAFSLPRSFYTDEAYHRLDLEQVFYREWIFAGHSCEVPKPGDRFTLQIGAYPLLVVRGGDGRIRAFHNICRHRGQQLCTKTKQSGRRIVCPYHQWSYDPDGRLAHARDMMEQVDPARFGLLPVQCEEMAGYVFVCLAEEPKDFAAFRAAAEPYMAPHRLEEAKVAYESTIVERGNWKLVLENNRECYHCRGCHPGLSRVFNDRPTQTDGTEGAGDDEVLAHQRRCEEMGLPSAFRLAPDAQHRVMRIPLSHGAESMTLDGRAAVAPLLADFPTAQLGSMLLFHYPNTWNHLLADHALSFRVLPLSATETEVTTKWLVHKDAVEGVDYDLQRLTEVWLATNDEDRRIVEDNQKGVNSPAYQPGPYSQLHEAGVIQFVEWYARLMTDRLQGRGGAVLNVA